MKHHDLTITHQYQTIAELVNSGLKTREIATLLGISRQCVRNGRRLAANHGLVKETVDAMYRPITTLKQEWPTMQFEDSDKASVAGCTYARRLS